MKRHGEHARVVAKHRLGAVSVVHVEVDDRDAAETELELRVTRGDRDVAEDAEAHRRASSAWWPGGRTSASPPTSTARIAQPAARHAASHVLGTAYVSGIEPALRVDALDGVDVPWRVDELDAIASRPARLRM